MNSRKGFRYLIVCLVLCCFCVLTGCTTPSNMSPKTDLESSVPTTPIIITTTLLVPTTVTPDVTTLTPHVTSTDMVSTIATPQLQSTKKAPDDPWVENFKMEKFAYGISDCIMKQAFPDIAKDPDYGLKSVHPKLVGISNEKWNAFYMDWSTGKNTGQSTFSVSKCQNVPYSESTTWDFAYVTARLTPRNARVTDYSIIVSINANSKTVAQLIQNETLTLDSPITIQSWIPIKRNEIESLGNPTINFNKIIATL